MSTPLNIPILIKQTAPDPTRPDTGFFPPSKAYTCLRSSSSARVHLPSCGEGASVAALGSPPNPSSIVLTALVTRPGARTTYILKEGGCAAASSYCPAIALSNSCRP